MNQYTTIAEAGAFILAGALIFLNVRCLGSTLLLFAVGAQLALRDGLWLLRQASKSPLKERNERISEIG